ncbi:MAG TPA: ABC transporter permease, partial [Anaerolineales bacterium]|nr:ABC transporter permease [Anaerolineales bacterium]
MEQNVDLIPDDKHWTMDIEPQRNLLDLRLRELWRYRDLVMLFVRRDFVAVYKQTILGPLWYLIQPLLTTITFTFIFGQIASLPTDGLPQFLFYMSGTVVWSYFADCLNKTSNTFVQNANLFGKVYFPRMAVPVSILISNLISFLIQFVLFIVFIFYFVLRGTSIQPNWLWIALSPVL